MLLLKVVTVQIIWQVSLLKNSYDHVNRGATMGHPTLLLDFISALEQKRLWQHGTSASRAWVLSLDKTDFTVVCLLI